MSRPGIGVDWGRPSRGAFDLPGDWKPPVGQDQRENIEVTLARTEARLVRALDMLKTFCTHKCYRRHIGGWCCRCRAKVDERVELCEACR